MKKLLLSIAFLTAGSVSIAQTVPLRQDWALKIGTSPLISPHGQTTGNSSVAYNKNTQRIYLTDRSVKISILDDQGNLHSQPTLATNTSWNADNLKFTKVRVADDHVIFAVNTATAVDANNKALVIYRWASETDMNPTRTVFAVTTRKGDSFTVTGTGDQTKLYIGGAGSNIVSVYTVVDGVIAPVFDITLNDNNHAKTSISAQSNGALWLNGTTAETRRVHFSPASGVVNSIDVVPSSSVPTAAANTEYFSDGDKDYIAVSGAVLGNPDANNLALKMRIYDVTNNFASPILTSEAEMFPYSDGTNGPSFPIANSNLNAFADVAVRRNIGGTYTFFHVVLGSGVASYTTETVLPVSFTAFTGSLVKGQSTLAWSTASERSNKGFDVLRSTDGKTFSSVGFVSSKGQDGKSSTELNYSFVDRNAMPGVNYYRLSQIDFDGKTTLSRNIVSVDLKLNTDMVSVYPNPATSYINVNTLGLDYKGYTYELFDTNGKKVKSEKARSGDHKIAIGSLAPSVYILKVSKANEAQQTVKVIKK